MKIGDRVFPYPVLSDVASDYLNSRFEASGTVNDEDLSFIQLSFELNLQCETLERLINEESAEYAVHIECASTSYRQMLRRADGSFSIEIPRSALGGTVERMGFVVATKDIPI